MMINETKAELINLLNDLIKKLESGEIEECDFKINDIVLWGYPKIKLLGNSLYFYPNLDKPATCSIELDKIQSLKAYYFIHLENKVIDLIDYKQEEIKKLETSPKDTITLKEFWESKENLCIHCDTEEKANTLLKAFDKIGKKWVTDSPYLECNNWKEYKNNTCYDNRGMYASTYYFGNNGYSIYEFEDVDLGGLENVED